MSIDLKTINEPCCAETANGSCRVLISKSKQCRTSECKFYKPIGCKDWIRLEDKRGVRLIPPEEIILTGGDDE